MTTPDKHTPLGHLAGMASTINQAGSTPGGLREILEQFENNIYTRLGEGSKDGLTFDEAIAAIEALVPEPPKVEELTKWLGGTDFDWYAKGYRRALDKIHRNFKGGV